MSYIQVPPDSTGKKIYHNTANVSNNLVHIQGMNVSDPINPEHSLYIDSYGSAYLRFKDGSPSLDVYTRLNCAHTNIIGLYEFTNGDYSDLFEVWNTTGGSFEYDQFLSGTKLITNSSNGASIIRSSNRSHYYQSGTSALILITAACNDQGKENNIREWGYYTENNGYFFRLKENGLNFVIRSIISGTVSEIEIPQNTWNKDLVDGSDTSQNLSKFILDITKMNLYWLEFSFPSGILHFGVYGNEGQKIICHTISNPGSTSFPQIRNASLPVRYSNYNTGITNGTSELTVYGFVVTSLGNSIDDYTFWRYTGPSCNSKLVTTNTPLYSIKAKVLLESGRYNSIQSYPENIEIFSEGGSVKLDIITHIDSANLLNTPNWNIFTGYSTEGDNTASVINLSDDNLFYKMKTFYVNPGSTSIDIGKFFDVNDEGITIMGNREDTVILTVVATKLSGNTVTITSDFNTRELW